MRFDGKVQHDGQYTTGEAAQVLGVTRQTVRNWCRSGRLPHTRDHAAAYFYLRGADLLAMRNKGATCADQPE